jgi:taurine dioxygenase
MMTSMTLAPVGALVTGIDLTHVTASEIARLRTLLADRGVVILPNQSLGDSAFIDFLQRFGSLVFTKGETPVDGFADLNIISNVGRTTPPRSVFHVDTSYVRRPPTYTALRAVEIPEQGGETLFTNQYRAYETLSGVLKARLEGRTVEHVLSGPQFDDGDETSASHPIFRRHPISGRVALYLSTPERCVAISGLEEVEGREMIEHLYRHSTSADNVLRHTWSPGDVVMWDNGCVLHRADHSDVVGDRVMHRGMVFAPDPAN